MLKGVGRFLTSIGFGNLILTITMLLVLDLWRGQAQIIEALHRAEMKPMSSTHTVTVGQNSFTFTHTTPWRTTDNSDASVLMERHFDEVEAAKVKLAELLAE